MTHSKLPIGVSIRKNIRSESLQIAFSYRGVQCRETLKIKPNKANIKYAEALRAEIISKIERGLFKYSEYFPESPKCNTFGEAQQKNLRIADLLKEYLTDLPRIVEPSTAVRYRRSIHGQLLPEFGDILVTELTPRRIRQWIKSKRCKRKTIANHLIPLVKVLRLAVVDGIILHSPMDAISLDDIIHKQAKVSDFKIDPFTPDEINQLLSVMEGQERNAFQFAFYTGVRTSELIGLTWEKVNLRHQSVLIDQAKVEGEMKGTKTGVKGEREVYLFPSAVQALESQAEFTQDCEFVFHNPRTNESWTNDQQLRRRAWLPAMKRSSLRYRNPYQTRHTYACLLIARNENLFWIASQMGHQGIEMINRHYGKFIEEAGDNAKYKPKFEW
ncbi:site-specific integrase [Zooshikella ganghwensis]|uniref:site-specific integrase n=1 Tax=Zooshikella ganghwensis TaxID=202772 RepID=UPI0004177CC4|nr:site-specific integrase [Zooshikella ganghwensis]